MKIDYSERVLDHFNNPKNQGEISGADASAQVGNPVCGDMIKIDLKITDNKITDIKFQTLGCVAAVAASSAITELAMNKSVSEARNIINKDVAEYLDGMPEQKLTCSNFAADALKKALKNYTPQ